MERERKRKEEEEKHQLAFACMYMGPRGKYLVGT